MFVGIHLPIIQISSKNKKIKLKVMYNIPREYKFLARLKNDYKGFIIIIDSYQKDRDR